MAEKINAHISLGSNTPDASNALAEATACLAALPGAEIAALSKIYLTEPQDMRDQPWFLNQVARLELDPCWLAPQFVNALLGLEKKLGRARSENPAMRYGQRRIDLDLLLFGDCSSADPHCLLPHPRMLRRAFVLYPLQEISPEITVCGKHPQEWLKGLAWKLQGNRIYQQEKTGWAHA